MNVIFSVFIEEVLVFMFFDRKRDKGILISLKVYKNICFENFLYFMNVIFSVFYGGSLCFVFFERKREKDILISLKNFSENKFFL
jgi:hypothetical protein